MDSLPPPPPPKKRGRPRRDDALWDNKLPAPAEIPSYGVGDRPDDFDPAEEGLPVFEAYVPPYEQEEEDLSLSDLEREELRELVAELDRREQEALRLFIPMPAQAAFFASKAGERLVRGGNRGGKTVVGAVECARACTGQDPHQKYPANDGRFVAVGKDLTHCGKVMWRKLIRPGAFKIIRDPETKKWRSYDPTAEWDQANPHLAKGSPPLIPSRYIKEIAWENKKDEIPKTVRFHNGWELNFFSSIGKPPQGWDIDVMWFDEEIDHPDWYTEAAARLMDRNGRFYWTATPQAGTQYLFDIHTRADEQKGDPDPTVEEFYLNLLTNPHISEKAVKEFTAKLNEDEYRIRVLGDFALLGMKVYSEFSPKGPHGIAAFPIPDEWTRYIAIDPGRQVCAILFAAVPPPQSEYAGRIYIYDELYIKKCNAQIFAERLAVKMGFQEFHAAFIDHRAGRQTEMGSGITHEEQYSRALKEAKVSFTRTGNKFTWASDDVRAGIEQVRLNLHLDHEGHSKFVVFKDTTPMLQWEAERYAYRKLPSGVVTDEPLKMHDHLMDCWRYLAMARLRYVKPKPRKHKPGYTHKALEQKRLRREKDMASSINLS